MCRREREGGEAQLHLEHEEEREKKEEFVIDLFWESNKHNAHP